MKIGDVPRQMQRSDLSGAFGRLAEAAHHTVYDETAMGYPFTDADKISVGSDLTGPSWKTEDCVTLLAR